MNIDSEYDALMLSMGELAVLGRQPSSTENILSLLPKVESENKEATLAEFGKIGQEQRNEFSKAIEMLAAPSQVARLHYSVADDAVTRMYLAWRPEEKNSVAVLAMSHGKLAVNLQPADKIESMLANVLALNSNLVPANFTKTLSAAATIILIAVMDYFRYARYHSLLTHLAPADSFNRQEVMERMEDAVSEDFRWPLLLLDKVFPAPIAGRFQEGEVTAALEELCQAGLLVKNEVEGGKPELTLYSLAGGAPMVSDSLLHDVSKVALSVSSAQEDGYIGNEAMLLVRGPSYLWLFGIGGREGMVASINSSRFTDVLQKFLAPPDKMPAMIKAVPRPSKTVPAGAGVAARAGTSVCPRCGTPKAIESKFCAKCGATLATPAAKFCPKCGDTVKAGEKFCDKCGAKLA